MNDRSRPDFTPVPADTSGLAHLSLLMVRGDGARTFLDSQLTRNVPAAGGLASPAGYCSPKGRLLASFVMWLEGDSIALLLAADIAAMIVKRLRMYVLRAKVTIDDVTASRGLGGVVAGVIAGPMGAAAVPDAASGLPVWGVAQVDATTYVRYPDVDGAARWLQVAGTPAATGTIDASTWRRLDIASGLALVTSATQDRFVPQMLNLEALGGVDFKKGCYPGQEVVARSQYLGKLKRRMALASIEGRAVPAPGTDVWSEDAHNEAAGLVVNAEPGPGGHILALVELPTALFASTTLHVGTPDGPRLALQPLPYALPENEVFVRPKL